MHISMAKKMHTTGNNAKCLLAMRFNALYHQSCYYIIVSIDIYNNFAESIFFPQFRIHTWNRWTCQVHVFISEKSFINYILNIRFIYVIRIQSTGMQWAYVQSFLFLLQYFLLSYQFNELWRMWVLEFFDKIKWTKKVN